MRDLLLDGLDKMGNILLDGPKRKCEWESCLEET